MGGINVKNTIVEKLMQNVAPHPCFGCGKIGSVLCDYCKYDIVSEPFVGCFLCGASTLAGVCENHDTNIKRAFLVGRRHGVLKALIDGLKFQHVKAAALAAAQLLDESLPVFPAGTIIVPLPTVRSHVRERGYDHADLIARHFGKLRSLEITPLLSRAGKATQHLLDKEERLDAAASAFHLNDKAAINVSDAPIVIMDDIITTGATVSAAADILAVTGRPIWVAALAYQPLD